MISVYSEAPSLPKKRNTSYNPKDVIDIDAPDGRDIQPERRKHALSVSHVEANTGSTPKRPKPAGVAPQASNEPKKKYRTLEERKQDLLNDPGCEDVQERSVVCTNCTLKVKLNEKRTKYDNANWLTHRKGCFKNTTIVRAKQTDSKLKSLRVITSN